MTGNTLPLTGLAVGSVSADVIVCGDPGRSTRIAQHLSDAKLLSDRREYRIYQGLSGDITVTVCSHGIGAPGAAIAFEELIAAGARRIIRLGTCGGLQPDIKAGHLIIATAAVQNTGYGRETVPPGYPAVADPDLSIALQQAAEKSNHPHVTGLVLTRDGFYRGVSMPSMPDYQTMSAANVQAVEMECAALFIVGSLRQVRTAAILAVDGNVLKNVESMDSYDPDQNIVVEALESTIDITLKALRNVNKALAT
jgi:uridine phosphorylase